jgi:glycerophosphoryl diester phosphodiesterase
MFFTRGGVQIVGHRGFPARFPDNTMAGFAAAFGEVDMVETDVRRSSDDRLVLCHDPVVGSHVVAETDWDVIRAVDLGAGQRPILLQEALAAFPDRGFNLEVKNWPADPGFEEDGRIGVEVAALARPGDLLSSFHWPTMDAVKVDRPDVATGLLLESHVAFDAAIDHAIERSHAVVIPEWSMLVGPGGAELIELAHRGGLGVATWTVNDVQVARRLARIGVDAIITNDPRMMVDALEEYS